jgi:hypothetical protein
MRIAILMFMPLLLLAQLSCASRSDRSSGEPDTAWSSTEEASLSAYDRLEGHFQTLCGRHQERYGQDPLLIEAREMAAAAEELYLLAEYRQALDLLQQAIDLLEERQGIEQTRR